MLLFKAALTRAQSSGALVAAKTSRVNPVAAKPNPAVKEGGSASARVPDSAGRRRLSVPTIKNFDLVSNK